MCDCIKWINFENHNNTLRIVHTKIKERKMVQRGIDNNMVERMNLAMAEVRDNVENVQAMVKANGLNMCADKAQLLVDAIKYIDQVRENMAELDNRELAEVADKINEYLNITREIQEKVKNRVASMK